MSEALLHSLFALSLSVGAPAEGSNQLVGARQTDAQRVEREIERLGGNKRVKVLT